jgi:NAD(P)-dependent dehydrogenase (short-subunit alcohol dehydrogenase family)
VTDLTHAADRFALVTGTSAGIGAAVAERLLAREWTVLGVARRGAALDHPRYRHARIDLADRERALPELDRLVIDAVRAKAWSRIGLVNNAAMGGLLGPLERVDAADLQRMLTVNVVMPVHLMGLFVAHTPADTALRIVNLSSGAATHAFPGLAAYAASKAALRMAGMVLASELASPIRTTPPPADRALVSYEPGIVETDMQRGARSQSPDAFPWVQLFHDFAAQGRLVGPEEPAREIVEILEQDGLPDFSERRLGVS